ncbi:HEPN domain-containing protein [Candidatus Palauibacter sp.]|uniref:HEPN domain-containing protein n=1 Tax=Candidatus Palauibacter sp. TaxID=3101350 RepID=UPI003D14AC07
MANPFSVIVDDFDETLNSLLLLVQIGQGTGVSPKTRVASIHATTLMLAAAFEEFIREMALEHARHVVNGAHSVSELPDMLLMTAWKRTLGEAVRLQVNGRSKRDALKMSAKQVRPKVDALCSFVEGDIQQNIYDHLIHNEINMRATQINKLFRVSGREDICSEVCKQGSLKAFFDREDERKTHGELLAALENFINRRNEIAHSLNSAVSSAPEEVYRIIKMLRAFARDLGVTLYDGNS